MMSVKEAYDVLKHPENYYSRHKAEARETAIKCFMHLYENCRGMVPFESLDVMLHIEEVLNDQR